MNSICTKRTTITKNNKNKNNNNSNKKKEKKKANTSKRKALTCELPTPSPLKKKKDGRQIYTEKRAKKRKIKKMNCETSMQSNSCTENNNKREEI